MDELAKFLYVGKENRCIRLENQAKNNILHDQSSIGAREVRHFDDSYQSNDDTDE